MAPVLRSHGHRTPARTPCRTATAVVAVTAVGLSPAAPRRSTRLVAAAAAARRDRVYSLKPDPALRLPPMLRSAALRYIARRPPREQIALHLANPGLYARDNCDGKLYCCAEVDDATFDGVTRHTISPKDALPVCRVKLGSAENLTHRRWGYRKCDSGGHKRLWLFAFRTKQRFRLERLNQLAFLCNHKRDLVRCSGCKTLHREFWLLLCVARCFAEVKQQVLAFATAIGDAESIEELDHYVFRNYQWRSEAFITDTWRMAKVDEAITKFFDTLLRLDQEGFPPDSLTLDDATFRAHLGLPSSCNVTIDPEKGYNSKAAGAFWISLLRFQVLDLLLSMTHGVSDTPSPKEPPPTATGPVSLLSALTNWPTFLESLKNKYAKDTKAADPSKPSTAEAVKSLIPAGAVVPEAFTPLLALTDMHAVTLATKTSKNFQTMGTALMWILECNTTNPFDIPTTMKIGDTFDCIGLPMYVLEWPTNDRFTNDPNDQDEYLRPPNIGRR
ncbi:hypothetical protein C8R46DRAFT_1219300 [Mycena filopes]|nr:hypothetical protein C8R46DRAFT_1219300 [Mycena filopes]